MRGMPDQSSDNHATNAQPFALPDPVLIALSIPGIDPTRFGAVIEAFGPLPIEGQVELANRLIFARGQYLVYRMSDCDSGAAKGVRRKRLEAIGKAASRLLRLLHRDKADPQPWNLHPAVTLALPYLCGVASEHGPKQVWDPPQGLSLLEGMLADLAEVGDQAEVIFESPFPKTQGGQRRRGRTASADLVHQLIDIYDDIRAKFPGSGPALAFGRPLLQFVRAALTFVVSAPREFTASDGRCYQPWEASFLETDLPETSRITDDAIRGIFDRRRPQTKPKKHLK
jgi:hypothetical protein